MKPRSRKFEAASKAALVALDALLEMEQAAPFVGIRAAAGRQLREALADVVSSVHRWELTEAMLNERKKQAA